MVVAATATDLFTDGLMTGAGSSIAAGLGLLLAASQVIGNIPNGFAATANLDTMSRKHRLTIAALVPLVALAGAAIGQLALDCAPPGVQAAALAFMTGMLLLATVEDTISQGDQRQPPRTQPSFAFAGGFVLMMLASTMVAA